MKIVKVKFLSNFGPYLKGQVAGFAPTMARKLTDAKVALAVSDTVEEAKGLPPVRQKLSEKITKKGK